MPLDTQNMSIQEKNKELMITLDDAWNSQDWDTFNERHADNVAIFWPGQPDPTRGVHNHLNDFSCPKNLDNVKRSLIASLL
jgi:hypothetical protein